MKKKVRIGVIGAGYWGGKIIGEYAQLSKERPDVELVEVADLVPRNRELVKEKYGVNVTDDYRRLLKNADAVHIATPNETHYEIAKNALKSGKHTLVEKPMTKKSEESSELVGLAEENNLTLQVGHVFRFDNSVKKLRDYVQDGQLGKIYTAKLLWTAPQFPLPKETDIIFDLAAHPIDISNHIFDEWPERVTAIAESYVRKKKGLEEWASLTLEYPDRKIVTVELSWIDPSKKKREIQVNGSFATAVVDTISQEMSLYGQGKRIEIPIQKSNTIKEEISHFVNVIEKNTPSTNSGYIGNKTVEVLEALRKSLEMRAPLEMTHAKLDIGKYSVITGGEIGLGTKIGNHSTIYECVIGKGCDIRNNVDLHQCEIGNRTKVETGVVMEGGVKIGDDNIIKPKVFFPTGVTTEDEVFVGSGVNFSNDKKPRVKGEWKLLKTHIGKGASIGSGSKILPVNIGEYAEIAMGSVVTKDIPPYAKAKGVPAKVYGYVDKETRK